jgi:hypothetical protein
MKTQKPQRSRRKPDREDRPREQSKPGQKPAQPAQSPEQRIAEIAHGKRTHRKALRLERARAGAPRITDLAEWERPDVDTVAGRTSEPERNEENKRAEEHQDEKTAP